MALTFHPDDLALGPLRYLLDFTWGGQTYHLSDGEYEIAFDGATYTYTPGLEYDANLKDRSDLFQLTPSASRATVVLHFAGLVNVPQRVAAGHDLRAATARLWMWPEGSTTRLLVLDGECREPAYGMPENEHAIEIDIVELAHEDRGRFPDNPRAKVITTTTHANPDSTPEGEWYPFVFGKPGNAGSGSGGAAPYVYATPGQLIDVSANVILVADGITGGGSVRVKNVTTITATNATVANTTDALGRRYSYVDTTSEAWAGAGGNVQPVGGDDLWVAWDVSSGGVIDVGGRAIEGAGDLIEYMLRRSSLRWDAGRVAAVKPLLNSYKLAGYIQPDPDERISPWDWLRREILPLLPVGVRSGPEGVYLIAFDPDGAAALVSLDTTLNCERTSSIVYDDADRYSEVRFSYEFRGGEDKPNAVAVLTGNTVTAAGEGVSLDPFLVAGRRLYGDNVLEKESPHVYEPATAIRICAWLARRHALPSRLVEYDVNPTLAYLEPGDYVSLTDAGVSLSKASAMVEQRDIRPDGRVLLQLRLWPTLGDLRS